VKATLLLADAAQVADGKLFVLGAGWQWTGPGPVSMAVAVLIEVPWDQTNVRHRWELDLVDADGAPVRVPTANGSEPVVARGEFEVGRPPGSVPGASLPVPVAVNFAGLSLPPAQRFSWLLRIDGATSEGWQLDFNTRPAST